MIEFRFTYQSLVGLVKDKEDLSSIWDCPENESCHCWHEFDFEKIFGFKPNDQVLCAWGEVYDERGLLEDQYLELQFKNDEDATFFKLKFSNDLDFTK